MSETSLFLTPDEYTRIRAKDRPAELADLEWLLNRRAESYAAQPGLTAPSDTVEWWHRVSDSLSIAAMAHAVRPSKTMAHWLHEAVLSVVRRPEDDWIGPSYRARSAGEPIGALETAHLCWGVSAALDLARKLFSESEQSEIRAVLLERGIPMCARWLETSDRMNNWRAVMTSGIAAAAAVLDDREWMNRAVKELPLCVAALQADGTSSESLQYGGYACYALMLAHEALRRRDPSLAAAVPVERYAGYARWAAASLLYNKPLEGWPAAAHPRSLNFNDSAAVFAPSPDLLLHIAVRAAESHPIEAGLARWLAGQAPVFAGPWDLSSFGFVPRAGFLALPLLSQAGAPLSPADAGLPEVVSFDCGDAILRDAWNGRTVVGFRGAGERLNGPGHLHGDLNSLIVVHNQERLLADAGHSCYRNAIHPLESSSAMHNTCVFTVPGDGDAAARVLQQSCAAQRKLDPTTRTPADPVDRGARRLISGQIGSVRVVGCDAASLYGDPISHFRRFVLLCGAHAIFVVDWVDAAKPVKTRWQWLVNNRDGRTDFKAIGNDRMVIRRGGAGMKVFHLAGGLPTPITHAFAHDAYHPQPGAWTEGRSGSGLLVGWEQPQPAARCMGVHAIPVDSYGMVAGWHLEQPDRRIALVAQQEQWSIEIDEPAMGITVFGPDVQPACRLIHTGDNAWRLINA